MHHPTKQSERTPVTGTYYQPTAYRGIRFWEELYQVQQEVAGGHRPKGTEQSVNPTAKAFDFDIVINTYQQYATAKAKVVFKSAVGTTRNSA